MELLINIIAILLVAVIIGFQFSRTRNLYKKNFQLFYAGVTFNYKYPFIYLLAALIGGILIDMPLIAAIYCFFIGLFLVLLSFIFQLSPGWKELFLIVTVLNYGFVISSFSRQNLSHRWPV